jgi:hypothetical protein
VAALGGCGAFPTDNFSTLRAAPDRTDLEAPISEVSEVSEVSADMEIRDLGGLRGLRGLR